MTQGNKNTQMTLIKLFDRHIEEVKSSVGIYIFHRTLPNSGAAKPGCEQAPTLGSALAFAYICRLS